MLHHHVQAKLIAGLRGIVASQLQRLAFPSLPQGILTDLAVASP